MEVSALNEVGVREKAISSVGNVREKLSEETSRIVKLQVEQETTYRELQEKHAELEGNHERLQQNMLQLRMEYEQLSAQYQEELRRRPEILNHLMSNRKIYEKLEDTMNRIRESMQRSAADRTALAEAYAQASENVTAAQAEYVSQINAANNATRSAQDLAKLKNEQCTQLSQYINVVSSQAEKTNAELQHVREQMDYHKDMCARYETQVQEKNKSIQDLREDLKRASSEFDERMERQRKIAADLEREAGAATALREALTQAKSRCEVLTTEGKRLTTELLAANTCIAQKQEQNQELQSQVEEAQRNMNFMVTKIDKTVKELNAKTQELQSLEDSLEESKKETIAANEQVVRLTNELERERREFEERFTAANNELERQRKEHEHELSSRVKRIEVDFAREKNDLNVKIQSYEDNLNQCNEIITSLKLEIEQIKDTRDKSLATINELKSKEERELKEKSELILDLERSLTEKSEMITNLQNELTINKEAISQANNTIQELEAEFQRQHNYFEEHKAALEIKIAESDKENVQLKQDLAQQSIKLAQAKEDLNTARADAANAMHHVRRLETTVRVEQETTYRELQEKHAELEGNHERLQQNMLQLRMEYEQLSAQHQEELRRRPEILNHLMSNRKIYEKLEDTMNRIRESMQRSAADRTALAEAYAQASENVTAAQAEYVSQINAANNATRSAQDLAKLKDEQCTQLSQYINVVSSQAEKTNAELQHVREQMDYHKDMCARYETQVQEKNKSIQDLREDLKRASSEFDERMERQRKIAADLEREAGAATALREALTQAKSRCEVLTTEGKRLTTELLAANTCIAQKQEQNQELQSQVEEAQRNMNFMVTKIDKTVKELNAKTQELQSLEDSLEESKKETIAANEQVVRLTNELERERREFEERFTAANNELERQRKEHEHELSSRVKRIEVDFAREKIDLNVKIQSYEDNLNQCNEIITSLKLEIEQIKDTRDKSLATINELKSKEERELKEKSELILDLERSLTEKSEMITNLQNELTINKEAISQTNTIQELEAEFQRQHNYFEEHKAALEIKIAESDKENVQLKQDLAQQSIKLAQAKEDLNTARADAANAMHHVRRLETTVRNKDDELSKQMKITMTARVENVKLNNKIRAMQNTINDVQQIATHRKPPPAASSESVHCEPPEHNHNAMDGPTPPHKQMPPMTLAPSRHQAPPAPLDPPEMFYNLVSDSDNSIGDLEINCRYEALSRDIQSCDTKKRKQAAAPITEPVQARADPQSQVPTEPKPRKFFKTRRLNRQ